MNSARVNLYSYCNNSANLHIFNLTNVSDFGIQMYIIQQFFQFILFNANALTPERERERESVYIYIKRLDSSVLYSE